jgi:molecular chaperone GrpE
MVKIHKKEDIPTDRELAQDQQAAEPAKTPDPSDDIEARLAAKEKEAAENYDKYLRAVAELENIKKRFARDKAETLKYGNETLLRDFLPFMDSIDRALSQTESAEGDLNAFREGLQLIRDQLSSCLKKHGVEQVECASKAFDPNVHEALYQVDSDKHKHNEVVDELEKGYLLSGRLLRPAKVSVCRKTGNSSTQEC